MLNQQSRSDDQDRHFRTDHLHSDLGGRTARGGMVTLTSQGVKFLIGIAATVVLARLLTPQDYGLIGMVAVITGFVSMFKDMGLSMATIQKEQINVEQVSALFWINVALSILVMLVTAFIAPVVSWFYHEPRLTPITIAFAAGFLFGGLTVQHEALLRRQMRFTSIAILEIGSMILGIMVAVGFAWYGARYWALVANQLTQALGYTAGIWIVCDWRPRWPSRKAQVGSMLAFGSNLTGFHVINYFARNLDNMLIGKFWGSWQLGLYAKAYQLLLLPIDQINTPIAAVAIPALSRLTDSPERYRKAYLRILEKVALITMPCMALMIACSDWFVKLILGPQWIAASRIFAFLGIVGLIQPVANTTGWLFITQGRTRDMFRWGLLGATIVIASIIVGLPWGAVGVAATYSSIFLLVVTPLLFWFVGRRGPVRTIDFYRTIAPIACAALSSLAALLVLRRSMPLMAPSMGLLIAFVTTLAVMLLVLMLLPQGRIALKDCRELVALLFRRPKGNSSGRSSYSHSKSSPLRRFAEQTWTISFVSDWWPYMSPRSILRLRDFELRSARGTLVNGRRLDLEMKSPIRGKISLREVGSDILTFDEVIKEEVYKGVLTHLRHCETIIDLGANIGLTSLYFGSHYPSSKLFAVEPNPDTYEILTSNLKQLIEVGRCRTLKVAVWGDEKTLVADSSRPTGHYSAFATKEASKEGGEAIINGLPIQKIISSSGFHRIDLLKVDIEGAEVELFKGDLGWLRRVRTIAIEFHNGSREASRFDEIMRSYDFHVYDHDRHTTLAVKEED